ncbi:hypothetical protein ACFQZ4_17175 [Catellatospora coxensis]|uniref:hypothetical protein n=1 Tax=Catellatospora coxensis TaxID=310354 RepID=UPI0031E44357
MTDSTPPWPADGRPHRRHGAHARDRADAARQRPPRPSPTVDLASPFRPTTHIHALRYDGCLPHPRRA